MTGVMPRRSSPHRASSWVLDYFMFLFTLSLALRPCIIKSCRWQSTPNSMENTYKWTFIRTIPKCILTNDVFSFKMLIKKTVLVCRGGINRRFPHLNTFRSSRRHFIGHVVCGTRHFWGDRICLLVQGRGNFELSVQSSYMACKRTTVVCRCLLGTAYLQRKQRKVLHHLDHLVNIGIFYPPKVSHAFRAGLILVQFSSSSRTLKMAATRGSWQNTDQNYG